MKLLILGATGPTGQQLVAQGLEAGHHVAALVRAESNLPPPVEVIRGDGRDPATIAAATRGRDAVLSALGTGKSFKGDIASRAAANLVAANVNRLIFVSAFGVGDSFDDATVPQKLFSARCCAASTPTKRRPTQRSRAAASIGRSCVR